MLTIKYLTLDGNISSITFQVQATKNKHVMVLIPAGLAFIICVLQICIKYKSYQHPM